jgi:hypothetical protein
VGLALLAGNLWLQGINMYDAHSYWPSPRTGEVKGPPQGKSENSGQTPHANQGYSIFPSLVLHITQAPKTEAEAAQDRAERDAKSSADWWLVKFTGGLVFVGFLQFCGLVATVCIFRRQECIMKQQSAIMSRQFAATHRPKLTLRRITLGAVSIGQPLRVDWILANVGATDAIIEDSDTTVRVMHEPLEPTPPFDRNKVMEGIVRPGPGFGWQKITAQPLSEREFDACAASLRYVFFLGYISYKDSTENRRYLSFCYKYDWGGQRFRPVDDPNYHYTDD